MDGKTRVVVRGPDLKSFVIFEYVVGLCCVILENKCTKDALGTNPRIFANDQGRC